MGHKNARTCRDIKHIHMNTLVQLKIIIIASGIYRLELHISYCKYYANLLSLLFDGVTLLSFGPIGQVPVVTTI